MDRHIHILVPQFLPTQKSINTSFQTVNTYGYCVLYTYVVAVCLQNSYRLIWLQRQERELSQRELTSRQNILSALQVEAKKMVSASPESTASRRILDECNEAEENLLSLLTYAKVVSFDSKLLLLCWFQRSKRSLSGRSNLSEKEFLIRPTDSVNSWHLGPTQRWAFSWDYIVDDLSTR